MPERTDTSADQEADGARATRVQAAAAARNAEIRAALTRGSPPPEPPGPAAAPPPWYAGIFSRGSSAPVTYGGRLAHYPGLDDLSAARSAEAGYGTGNEAFTDGRAAQVWSVPAKGGRMPVGLDDVAGSGTHNPQMRGIVDGTPATADEYMAAQLASLRSPITALGYQPRAATLDVKSGRGVNVAGQYDPKKDSIYSNVAFPSNLIHESTHRGLEMLRKEGLIPKSLQDRLPPEEMVVRYIMALHMGDPEKGSGSVGDEQRLSGLYAFGRDPGDPQKMASGSGGFAAEHRKALVELTDIAAKHLASLKPGGPR